MPYVSAEIPPAGAPAVAPLCRSKMGSKIEKVYKELNDTFRLGRQGRTVPEGTVRALVVVIVSVKFHDHPVLLHCQPPNIPNLRFHTLPERLDKAIIRRCVRS